MFKFLKKCLFYNSRNEVVNNLKICVFGTIFFYFILWRLSDLEFAIENLNEYILVKNLYSPLFDNSYFEFFQYILLLWCSVVALRITTKTKFRFALPIPIIYIFLFLNDFLRIHDSIVPNYSNYLRTKYSFIERILFFSGLEEFLYWGIVLFLIILIIFIFSRNSNHESQEFMKINLVFFVTLAFFGIFIDEFNNILYFLGDNKFLKILSFSLFTLEEFGEISTIAFAFIWLINFSSNKMIKDKFTK